MARALLFCAVSTVAVTPTAELTFATTTLGAAPASFGVALPTSKGSALRLTLRWAGGLADGCAPEVDKWSDAEEHQQRARHGLRHSTRSGASHMPQRRASCHSRGRYGTSITGKAASRLGNTTVITGNPDYPGNYR